MALLCSYEVESGELIVRSTKNGEILWKGKPKGYDVGQVFPINGSNDCIVLLEWQKTRVENQRNLLRLDPCGKIIWVIEDPTKKIISGPKREQEVESYTQVLIKNSQWIASTYSGFADYIDIETGAIIKSEFVK